MIFNALARLSNNKVLMSAALCAASSLVPLCSVRAQSTINIYGIIDSGVEAVTNVGASGSSIVRIPSLTGTLPSRLGFRGSEDLGGGAKALFVLEQGFAVDQGTLNQGGRIWGRQAYVALSNQWGTLGFGRQYTQLFLSLIGDTMGPNIYGIGLLDGYLPNARVDNSIFYRGTFSGWTVGTTVSLGRDTAGTVPAGGCAGESATDRKACRDVSSALQYLSTDWSVAVSTEKMNGGAGAGSPLPLSSQTDTRTSLSGYYKVFGATLGAGLLARKNEGAVAPKSNLYWGGFTYPVNNLVFDAQVARLSVQDSPNDATMMTARAMYLFSKRTATYIAVGRMQNQGGAAFTIDGGSFSGSSPLPGRSQNGMMVGVRHSF